MIKILFCSNVFPPHVIGGAELIAYYHAKVLRDLGCEIAIFCGDPSGSGPRHSMHEGVYEGMTTFRVRLTPEDFRPDFVNFCHARVEEHFDSVLRRLQPDIVHMHNLIGLSVGLIGRARSRRCPTVLTVHDHWGFCHKNTLLKTGADVCRDHKCCYECMPQIDDGGSRRLPIRLRRDFIGLQLESLDALISPSSYLATAYGRAGVVPATRHVIEYGIDVGRYSQVSKSPRSGPVRFTFIGYLGPHKGVPLLIDAAQRLRHAGLIINLVGSGELMEPLRLRVQKECLSDVVHFLGKMDNQSIAQVFQETDVLVLPSIWPENQPVTILEAMATRTPVVAAAIGGIPEMVVNGVTGYLFEPGNAVHLADRMAEFVKNPQRIAEFGAAGFERIREHSYENSIRKILALYQDIRDVGSKPMDDRTAVIACAGERFNQPAAEAMDWIDRCRQHDSWRFTMHDWTSGGGVANPKVLWVVDDGFPVNGVHSAMQNRVPLLVPDQHLALKEICRRENCGLYYRNAAEAYECLHYLIHNCAVSAALGENGFAFWARSRSDRSGGDTHSTAQHAGH